MKVGVTIFQINRGSHYVSQKFFESLKSCDPRPSGTVPGCAEWLRRRSRSPPQPRLSKFILAVCSTKDKTFNNIISRIELIYIMFTFTQPRNIET